MQIRSQWAFRAAAAGALLTLFGASAKAAPPTPRPEKTLVGISLLARFSDVLRKFGQPNEIQVGQPTLSASAQGGGQQGAQGGGFPGMGGRMPGGMGSGPMGMMPGGMGGPSNLPPSMRGSLPGGGGGPSGMPPSMMGSFPGGGGLPGMSGGPGMGGGMGGPGMSGGFPGMGGFGMGGSNSQAVTGNETTWWYHFPKQGLHYSFLFNRQGRVIQIQAYGYKSATGIPAARTAEGITLGDSLGNVIRRYGWSNDGEHSGDYVVLRYGAPDQVAFQARHNEVIGIVLGIVK